MSFAWPPDVRFLVATPDRELRTAEARLVVPTTLSREDAVFNLQRMARLLHAAWTGDGGSFREALKDRWHQPARSALIPELQAALAIEDPDLLGVCLSGAGPSIVALARHGCDRIGGLLEQVYRECGSRVTIRDVAAEPSRVPVPARATRD